MKDGAASVILPLEFSSFETQDLSAWRGEPENDEFLELAETVRKMVSQDRREPAAPTRPEQPPAIGGQLTRPGKRRLQHMLTAIFAALVLIGGAAITVVSWKTAPASPPSKQAQQAPKPNVTPTALSPVLPHLAYGTWTLRNAVDEQGNVSPDEGTLVTGRWGVTQLKHEAGISGRWEVVR